MANEHRSPTHSDDAPAEAKSRGGYLSDELYSGVDGDGADMDAEDGYDGEEDMDGETEDYAEAEADADSEADPEADSDADSDSDMDADYGAGGQMGGSRRNAGGGGAAGRAPRRSGGSPRRKDGGSEGMSAPTPPARRSLHVDAPPRRARVGVRAGAGTRPRSGSAASSQDAAARALEDERLFTLYRDTRDVKVRNDIVGRHMYLIDIITRKFVNRGVEYEDLYQIASIALIKAVERFDLAKGVKFVSFATPTIVGEIKRYFRDKGSTIRIPRRIYEIYQKVNQAKEYLSQELCRTPMVSDIAEYLKISEENVLEIIESWNVYNIQSFEQNAYSEDNLELHETIGEDDFEFEKIENRDFIEKSMEKFNDSEREFINLRYMNDMTQKEIAAVMNVSQMYISRLEKKIIKKFRIILEK